MPDLKSHQTLFERQRQFFSPIQGAASVPPPVDLADLERRVADLEDRARREHMVYEARRRLEYLGFEFPLKTSTGIELVPIEVTEEVRIK